ncbi:MAG: hypothetical protein VR71_16395 [Roseovarius sp. BRH_c41]|uniref:DUF3800 domain-containing protein n=1 Tax=Roseovarius sp. BRH_c41 TaxID=1629709 RepID=UPI0005F16AE3|nr:DUF3800 domain-containing protein [Roseovarius sp. BRH_c41]KJS41990.1 MAG: hypothetical protein VR71_16395 [Roseovarius sp. BRH_c41]
MSWALFVDESGQDQRNSPYEVLAGVAVEDRQIWPLIRQISDAQQHFFGMRLFEAYGAEAKAKELLKTKAYKHAAQMDAFGNADRMRLAKEMLEDGENPTRARLTALAQAKIAYCEFILELTRRYGGRVFATMVPQDAPRPPNGEQMRKDYAFFLERYYHFLNQSHGDPMGFLVFDELDKTSSHVLLGQISRYFQRTSNGRTRSRLIIPEPFFVHSDLTALVQLADLVAYLISWGLRLPRMPASPRPELEPLVDIIQRMKYQHMTGGGYPVWGIKEVRDLRPQPTTPH